MGVLLQMPQIMKTTKCTLLILFFIPGFIYAQLNLRPGYVITNYNDTVYGSIDFRSANYNALQCTFKELGSEKTTNYNPGEIYAYRFTDDGKFYVTRKVTINSQEENYFLEYIIQGIINMYYLPGNPVRFFFETEDGNMLEVTKEDQVITNDDGRTGIRQDTRYIGRLNNLFGKSERAKKDISRLTFSKDGLAKITRNYHYDVCETGEECIEFESKRETEFVKVSFSILAGVKNHSLLIQELNKFWNTGDMHSTTPSIGVDLGLSAPRVSKTFSLHITAEGSLFKSEKTVPSEHYPYSLIKVKAFLLDNKIGVRYAPLQGKAQPFIEAGAIQTLLFGKDISASNEVANGNEVTIVSHDHSDYSSSYYGGFYVGAGLMCGIGKHTLSLSGYYCHKLSNSRDATLSSHKLRTFEVMAGFTF